jgi:hypothetical protein
LKLVIDHRTLPVTQPYRANPVGKDHQGIHARLAGLCRKRLMAARPRGSMLAAIPTKL